MTSVLPPKALINLQEDELVCRKTAAKLLKINPHTLAVWACTGRYSLPFIKIGTSVRYRVSDLAKFVENRTVLMVPNDKGAI